MVTLLPIEHPQIVDRDRNRGIPRSEGVRRDLEHPLEEGFRSHVVTRGPVEQGEIIDRVDYAGMLGAERSFLDRERALCERNRLVEAALAVERVDIGIERLDFRGFGRLLRESRRTQQQREGRHHHQSAGALHLCA